MSHFEKFQQTLQEMGIPFQLGDDSEESSLEESLDTVVIVPLPGVQGYDIYFCFKRDGSFKDYSTDLGAK